MNAQSPTSGVNLAQHIMDQCASLLTWQAEIEAALHHGGDTENFNHVVAKVIGGHLTMYEFKTCFILMTVVEFPNYSNYHGYIAGGNMDALRSKLGYMDQERERLGCRRLTINGRKGWERVLKQDGWQHHLSTMYWEAP